MQELVTFGEGAVMYTAVDREEEAVHIVQDSDDGLGCVRLRVSRCCICSHAGGVLGGGGGEEEVYYVYIQ